LDLTDNDMILVGAGAAGEQSTRLLIRNAYRNGLFNGTGLNTSLGATTGSTALGYTLNGGANIGKVTTFDGVAVGASDVYIKYTYQGDTDLNGLLDNNDYGQIDLNQGSTGTVWTSGDVDYNGQTDNNDYGPVDLNLGAGTTGNPNPRL